MDVAQMSRPTEFKAGLPEDFSGRNEDTTRWLLAMKAYFVINERVYTEDTTTVLIFLNKLSKGRGTTFAEGWCYGRGAPYSLFPFLFGRLYYA